MLSVISNLPWWVIYRISDVVYFILYYIIKHDRDTVMYNLSIVFPNKTIKERKSIAKQFYRNFSDTIFEDIKLLNINNKELEKMIVTNLDVVNGVIKTKQNIQLHSGHFFNWNFYSAHINKSKDYHGMAVYKKLGSNTLNSFIKRLRQKFGTIMIEKSEYHDTIKKYNDKPFQILMICDNNTSLDKKTIFFNKQVTFTLGPEKMAKKYNCAVVYTEIFKIKRGLYNFHHTLITTNPNEMDNITQVISTHIEESIKRNPSNYLWSQKLF